MECYGGWKKSVARSFRVREGEVKQSRNNGELGGDKNLI